MSPQPSRLDVTATGDRSLSADGIIDSHTADGLLELVRNLGVDGEILLDLTQVGFIDSSGLRSLVTSHQELEAGGSRLVLQGTSDSVRRLLEMTGLIEHLHLE